MDSKVYECPICKEGYTYRDAMNNYCKYCGQKFLWEVEQMICENCKFKDDCGWYESYKRIEDEILIGIGTDNIVGKALLNIIQDNQLEECEYFE